MAASASALKPTVTARLLEGLSPAELKVVLDAARPQRFLSNSVIFHQDTPANYMFLLTKGRARHFVITADGRKVVLFWLLPGDIIGGAAMLSRPHDYLVSTETIKESFLLRWDRKTIQSLAYQYPKLMENILSTAFDYFVWYLAAHLALTCQNAQDRLASVLSNLAAGIGQHHPQGAQLDVTNEELAHSSNLTVFTVSRLMSDWQRRGAIVKSRGKVLIRSHKELFRPNRNLDL